MKNCPEIEAFLDEHCRLPAWFVPEFRRETEWCRYRWPEIPFEGRGVVICADAVKYGTLAMRLVDRLRQLGCDLPIQWWRLPEDSWNEGIENHASTYGCTFAIYDPPGKERRGWAMKAAAVAMSPFREVLFLDADVVPLVNPERLFGNGTTFWPCHEPGSPARWQAFGLPPSTRPEWDTGVFLIDKGIDKGADWPAVALSRWLNDLADVTYRVTIGDPFTFQAAFAALQRTPVEMPPAEPRPWGLLHFDCDGPIIEHRCWDKA